MFKYKVGALIVGNGRQGEGIVGREGFDPVPRLRIFYQIYLFSRREDKQFVILSPGKKKAQ